jgi:formimidoylglutamate deiminase
MDAGVDDEEIVHRVSGGGEGRRLAFRHVLTPEGFVTDAALVLDGTGRIVAVEPALPPWDGWCALPAMVDAHSHAFQRLLTGLGERSLEAGSFWSWRGLMYRAAEALGPEDLEAVATVTYEALRTGGYAAVGEFHYLHRDAGGGLSAETAHALARAAGRVGIRLVLIPALYQRGGYDRPVAGAQERFLASDIEAFLDYAADLPGAGRAVAVHSLRAVDPAQAAEFVERARARFGDDLRLHIHAAEQLAEVEEVRRHEGRGPIAVLDALGLLDARTAVVHATHATPEERALLARRGARVVLCPQTEAYLGDGIFPLHPFQDEGGLWAIGSDANTRAGALDELRLLEYEARLVEKERVRLAPGPGLARALWTRAAREGAHTLGLPSGEIRPGFLADLLVLDPAEVPWTPADPDVFLDACLLGDAAEAAVALYVGGVKRRPLRALDPARWNAALARFRRLQEDLFP